MTIEEEIKHFEDFLSHPCGFEVSLFSILEIRPVNESSPPTEWEVSWIELKDDIEITSYKEFHSLHDACQYFVERRHYLCLGADFKKIMMGENHSSVEIIE